MKDKAKELFGFGTGAPASPAPPAVEEPKREAPRANPDRDKSWDAHDPAREGVVGWVGMGARERGACVLAALLAGYPMDPATFRYNPRPDIAFVVRSLEDPSDPKGARTSVAIASPKPLSETLDKLRAILGPEAQVAHRALAMSADKARGLLLEIRGRR